MSKPKKTAAAFFAENAVVRTRTSGTGNGGRYNVKSRRLVIPATFARKSVAVAVQNGVLVVGGVGPFKVHPTQHFVTLPAGTVATKSSITLERTKLPKAVAESDDDAVAYLLPKAAAKKPKAQPKAAADKPKA